MMKLCQDRRTALQRKEDRCHWKGTCLTYFSSSHRTTYCSPSNYFNCCSNGMCVVSKGVCVCVCVMSKGVCVWCAMLLSTLSPRPDNYTSPPHLHSLSYKLDSTSFARVIPQARSPNMGVYLFIVIIINVFICKVVVTRQEWGWDYETVGITQGQKTEE